MTIEVWNLVFSAITSGLVLVGGIWLRYVVAQQLKTKDTTIETLNAAIKLHEVEISGLKGDRAPAIAAEYKVMREHADMMTEEKRKLDEQVKLLIEQQKEKDKKGGLPVQDDPVKAKLNQATGLVLAANILLKHINKPSNGGIPNKVFVAGTFEAIKEITTEVKDRHALAQQSGSKPN